MKYKMKMRALGALILLGSAFGFTGCKSAPDLSKDQAMSMIQAKYDQSPGAPFSISVDDRGMQQGVHANYWLGTQRYPNGYWADFKLTPAGQKVVKLSTPGDVIQWRPEGPSDPHYAIVVTPLVSSKLKARDPGDVQSLGDNRTMGFMEDVDLSSLPAPLQDIAHNPGNRLSSPRTATFALTNGAWALQSIQ